MKYWKKKEKCPFCKEYIKFTSHKQKHCQKPECRNALANVRMKLTYKDRYKDRVYGNK